MTDSQLSTGDVQQVRIIAEAFAESIVSRFPATEKMEIPAPMKWAAGIISALMTAGIIGIFMWLVTSVNDMQQTLVRIDERQKAQVESLDSRFSDYDRRITRLEKFHNLDGGVR